MKDRLLSSLERAQEALKNRRIEIRGLEDLKIDVKKAFDEAILSIPERRRDLIKEIEERRESLKKWRKSFIKNIFPLDVRYLVSMPFIYGMMVPLTFFDVNLEIYHQVAFRLYGIPLVNRKEHFIWDRQLLPYLNWFEKFNCIYCSYANNLVRYAGEIAGRTERFWCPIKYGRRIENSHSQYDKFVAFLDAEEFRKKWSKLRDFSDVVAEEKYKHEVCKVN